MANNSIKSLTIARWLVALIIVALMFSPAITNLAELLLILIIVTSAELRKRLITNCRQPMAITAIIFYILIGIGVLYSMSSYQEAVGMWFGWRKLLLLPITMALFDDNKSKLDLTLVLIASATFFCLMSFVGIGANFYFPVPEHALGITVRNHATQGMIFSAAAFAAAALALDFKRLSRPFRIALLFTSLLLIINIAFISGGRSGYVVLIVCSASMVIGLLSSNNRFKIKSISIGIFSLALIATTLILAPSSHQRIVQAFDEAVHYQDATHVTSMGIRMYFWKNTLEMIERKPLTGYGTGAFESAYREQVSNKSGIAATITSDPHNQFLKIAVEHGILGLLVFLVFLGSSLLQRPSTPYRILGLGVLAAWMTTSLANSHFSTFSEGVFVYVWVGAMLANGNRNNTPAEQTNLL